LENLLLVVATEGEIIPEFRREGYDLYPLNPFGIQADILVTGPGAVPTTLALSRVIDSYSFIVNIGIAGSYSNDLPLGSVVLVDSDAFADYGIDDNGTFRHIDTVIQPKSLALSELVNPYAIDFKSNLRRVKGITVSTSSGSIQKISLLKSNWNAQVETMESAAVFYVCLKLSKPFACVRAISNYVEPRNQKSWQIDMAVQNLWQQLITIVTTLNEYAPKITKARKHESTKARNTKERRHEGTKARKNKGKNYEKR